MPHIGWNSLDIKQNDGLFQNIAPEPYVYFVHSYYLKAQDREIVSATTTYGIEPVSYTHLDVYKRQQQTIEIPTRQVKDIYAVACRMLKQHYKWKQPIRALGISAVSYTHLHRYS